MAKTGLHSTSKKKRGLLIPLTLLLVSGLSVLGWQNSYTANAQDLKSLPVILKPYSDLKYPSTKFIGIERISEDEVLLPTEKTISTYNLRTKQEHLLYSHPLNGELVNGVTVLKFIHSFSMISPGEALVGEGVGASMDWEFKILNVKTGQMRAIASHFKVPRFSASVIRLQDGRIFFLGGMDASHKTLSSVEIFNPKTEKFTFHETNIRARWAPATVLMSDGKILVIGGQANHPSEEKLDLKAFPIEVLNPKTFLVERQIEMPPSHGEGTGWALPLKNGKVLVSISEIYDYKSNNFTSIEEKIIIPENSSRQSFPPVCGAKPCTNVGYASRSEASPSHIALSNGDFLTFGGTRQGLPLRVVKLYSIKKNEIFPFGKIDKELTVFKTLEEGNVLYIFSAKPLFTGNSGVFTIDLKGDK